LALKRVRKNKGSPGIDGMTLEELPGHLAKEWTRLREELLAGSYQPKPVKRQEIPKSNGGVRELGIPTVLDRFIQQAILQVLQPKIDPSFSEHSYGFRPGRDAHGAVRAAQKYIQEGRTWVVDIDLERFFDRVNHDVLMGRVAKRVTDKRLLKLIRSYLVAGIMVHGVVMERDEGAPQGGPLSPFLANVLLDEVDKELERRGHAFCRYADDCNVYVRSERAGGRVMEALKKDYGKLRLRVNESKSAVARPWDRKFLGYSFYETPEGEVRRRIAPKALVVMKDRIRQMTCRTRGRTLREVVRELREYLPGWRNYFRLSEGPWNPFLDLDKWIRRRLRMFQLSQWKNFRTIVRELRSRGVGPESAVAAARQVGRWWRTAAHPALHAAFPTRYFDSLGVPRLAAP
jgi:group II intron reverse transcriptase/maturase